MLALHAPRVAGSHTLQQVGVSLQSVPRHRSLVPQHVRAGSHECQQPGNTSQRGLSARASSQASASTSSNTAQQQSFGQEQDDFAVDQRPVILFDGVCNMCNAGVNLVLDWDTQHSFRFAALQSPAGRRLLKRSGRSPEDLSSIVLVERARCSIKSQAFLRIGEKLGGPFPMLAALGGPVPGPLRDVMYDQLAANRYSVAGKRTECRLSDDGGFAARFIQD